MWEGGRSGPRARRGGNQPEILRAQPVKAASPRSDSGESDLFNWPMLRHYRIRIPFRRTAARVFATRRRLEGGRDPYRREGLKRQIPPEGCRGWAWGQNGRGHHAPGTPRGGSGGDERAG